MKEFRLKNYPSVELYEIPNFLNEQECDHLVTLIDANTQPSKKESTVVSDYRVNSACTLPDSDLTTQVVDQKIRAILKTSDYGERVQGQSRQHFKAHNDYFSGDDFIKHCTERKLGNRSWTFVIYLNDVELGGETEFIKLGLKYKPKKGTAVVWKNTDKDGKTYSDTIHSENPILKGTKYTITKWFRHSISENKQVIGDSNLPKLFKTRYELDKFTEKGFEVMPVPEPLWGIIKDTYELLKPTVAPEKGYTMITSDGDEVPSDILNMEQVPNIRDYIHKFLQPIHEEWSKQPLEMTYCYGIRSYRKGAKLGTHVDRIATHQIACIILVDEVSHEPWPLQIMDNAGKWHEVVIKPGQMILYESATCEHGRIKPFNGEYFRNFFVHYKLKNYYYNG